MLSQTAAYALQIMGYIANHGTPQTPVLAQTISEEMKIPRNFLSKIAHKLVQTGLLLSTRGKNGGFVLAKKAKEISMFHVVEHFMCTKDLSRCFLGSRPCNGKCQLHCDWKPIWKEFKTLLEKKTVDKILPQQGAQHN